MNFTLQIGIVNKILTRYSKISVDDNYLTMVPIKSGSIKRYPIKEIRKVFPIGNIWGFWNEIKIELNNERIIKIEWLAKDDARKLYNALTSVLSQKYLEENIHIAKNLFNQIFQEIDNKYLQQKKLEDKKKLILQKLPEINHINELPKSLSNSSIFENLFQIVHNSERYRREHNKNFIDKELITYKKYFDSIEKNRLTKNQRLAVITNEENNLVIAGAGSGKTSVIVAKIGYLIQKYNFKPNEILVMAFNNKASEELKERVKKRLNLDNMSISTFHSLGMNIITKVEDVKPSVAKWAEDDSLKAKVIEEIIKYLLKTNNGFYKNFMSFFYRPFANYISKYEFKSENEYQNYLKNNDIVTLNNEKVKSYEECEIANFLYLNQIKYIYEYSYKFNTANRQYRQYRPDFYLPEYDIYIEHFGIDENNNPAPYIDKEKYIKGIEWKRKIHQKYNTIMIETYSYEKKYNQLLKNLYNKLKNYNVKFKPISFKQALKTLNKRGLVNELSKNIATFITHYKSSHIGKNELEKRAKNDDRLKAFIKIIFLIMEQYEEKNKRENVIDFEDMINKAVEYVESGKYISTYRAILVDEFQDISVARAKLVKALKNKTDTIFTAVGDDWQAINRYAGGDISIFYNFLDFFGNTEKITLDCTFRFNNKINEVAQKFIQKNPYQIKKNIQTIKKTDKPKIFIWWFDDIENSESNISFILDNIEIDKYKSCLILGRNKYSYNVNLSDIKKKYQHIKFRPMSVHKAKGLESDIVIINRVIHDILGFPSMISNDPIVTLAMSNIEDYPFAEERRLFYVALTRAKDEVHIVTNKNNPSIFIKEFLNDHYEVENKYLNNEKVLLCPKCGGILVKRKNRHGEIFYGCENFKSHRCTYTTSIPEQFQKKKNKKTVKNNVTSNETRSNLNQKSIDNELKLKLFDLKEKITKELSLDKSTLLSDEMIDIFIEKKPIKRSDFFKIPLKLREKINYKEAKYLEEIFEVIKITKNS
ncbi:UvrD-helicase domain-containing protein [Nitrosophilus kaiyonis]|uniref:UvrD-helicase domain-containing protein n=1 Tax=Nitrosophilus kaiyonis TaxID=2930200 RepID=UPI00248F7BC2|nr:UvrD-helicase domain-containing protein [Nitrosophilus kaiyonis]